MGNDYDIGYYRRREQNARHMAEASSDHQIKRIHNDMADRYAEKARELLVKPRFQVVRP